MDGRHTDLLIAIVLAVLGVALAQPAGAGATCGGVERAQPRNPRGAEAPPLAVGDSVMLGALDELVAAGFEVDTRGCRQMGEGLEVLGARARSGTLPPVIVVALGANWTVTTEEIRRALMIVGRQRVLGLVVPRELDGEVTSDQANMRAAGRRWRRRVKVLDWARHSSRHPSWTWGDGLHLTPAGAMGFTRLLERAFDWPIPGVRVHFSPLPSPAIPESLSEGSALRARS